MNIVKKIGIIGLGTVGEAALVSIKKQCSLIEKRTAIKLKVVKVCDARREKSRFADKHSVFFTDNPYDIINDSDIDVVVELIGGIEPARTYILRSLKRGKDVVTANKALLARYGKQIFNVAKKSNRNIGFEASVCGAIPLIQIISRGLAGCKVRKLYGILNGTTNYILYMMAKKKMSFASALKEAQDKGFAEQKANFDIDGIDTLHKLSILSYLCFGAWPSLENIHVEGISRVSLLDIIYADELSYTIKLIAIARKEKNGLDLRVHPALIPCEHPLAQVNLAFNAVWLDAYPAGELLFYGEGAGGVPTSSSVISDIVNISLAKPSFIQERRDIRFVNIGNIVNRYYIRFMAKDRPGVLSKISKILASLDISIASVTQKERKEKNFVPIVMVTHQAKEGNIQKAISRIDKLSVIKGPSQVIRIENL